MTHPIFRTPAEVEDTAGVERIDDLLAQRTALVRELARLRPLYGPLGMWGHRRKVELARLTALLRAQSTAAGEKPWSEARLDTEAHAHPDYVAMIAHGTSESARWVECEEGLQAIDMRINRGQALLRFASSEPKT